MRKLQRQICLIYDYIIEKSILNLMKKKAKKLFLEKNFIYISKELNKTIIE